MNELEKLKPEVAAQAYSMEAIRGAVARGWCAPVNERKVMDADLAEAIAREVSAMLAAAPQPQAAEPVAWMHPELHEGHPYPEECLTTEAIDGWLPLYTHPQPAQDAALRSANERAESELAALKRRIAESVIWDSGDFVQTGSGATELVGGKRYRLLLDE